MGSAPSSPPTSFSLLPPEEQAAVLEPGFTSYLRQSIKAAGGNVKRHRKLLNGTQHVASLSLSLYLALFLSSFLCTPSTPFLL